MLYCSLSSISMQAFQVRIVEICGAHIRERKFTLSEVKFEIDNWLKVGGCSILRTQAYKREDTLIAYGALLYMSSLRSVMTILYSIASFLTRNTLCIISSLNDDFICWSDDDDEDELAAQRGADKTGQLLPTVWWIVNCHQRDLNRWPHSLKPSQAATERKQTT